MFFSVHLMITMYQLYHVKDYLYMVTYDYDEKNDFYLHEYFVPKLENITFNKKKNVIIILAEALEKKHFEDNRSYLNNLDTFYDKYIHNTNLVSCYGTPWTIAACVAWHFGIPLQVPRGLTVNDHFGDVFLPKALSIFDVLEKNGYDLSLVMGSYARFAGNDVLFKTHGNFNIFDASYFDKTECINSRYTINEWGYDDSIVFKKALELYNKSIKKNTPFVLFIQTLDSHNPGYCAVEKRKYHDVRDSIVETDKIIYDFVSNIINELDNTVIFIIGDHSRQRTYNDRLYNIIIGDVPKVPLHKFNEMIIPFDIAPTILQGAGAKWNNDKFGFGISLFSDESSYAQKLGLENFNQKLIPYSKFYEKFKN